MDTSEVNSEEYVLVNDDEAQIVIEELYSIIRKNKTVTLADFKQLIGEEPAGYTDYKYGWGKDAVFSVQKIDEGYLLVLPEVTSIAELMTNQALDTSPQ